MAVNRDFSDLFAALNDAGVRYLLVGGYAIAVHANPRATKDLDIWVEPTPANGARVYAALGAFGAPLRGLTAEDFATPGIIFQIGVEPNRIDIITTISGDISFKSAWTARVRAEYGGHVVNVIGRRHLIKNKEATGRAQDLADVQQLRKRPK